MQAHQKIKHSYFWANNHWKNPTRGKTSEREILFISSSFTRKIHTIKQPSKKYHKLISFTEQQNSLKTVATYLDFCTKNNPKIRTDVRPVTTINAVVWSSISVQKYCLEICAQNCMELIIDLVPRNSCRNSPSKSVPNPHYMTINKCCTDKKFVLYEHEINAEFLPLFASQLQPCFVESS